MLLGASPRVELWTIRGRAPRGWWCGCVAWRLAARGPVDHPWWGSARLVVRALFGASLRVGAWNHSVARLLAAGGACGAAWLARTFSLCLA